MKTREIKLTHEGERLLDLGEDEFGVPGKEVRFTREQVAEALCIQSVLFLQIDTEDPTTITSEIGQLLNARKIIKETGSNEDLLVPK